MFQRPRGTRDFTPEEMKFRRNILDIMIKTAELWGYDEVATPTFEHASLFTARSGEGIRKQLYTFEDKAGREMTLRPELTAPVARFVSADMRSVPRPIRLYYFGNCFRYEEPQKGRYREFWQFGSEHIGKITPAATAEIMAMSYNIIKKTSIKFTMRIGHVGITSMILDMLTEKDSNNEINGRNKRDARLYAAVDKKDAVALKDILGEKYKTVESFIEPVKFHDADDRLTTALKNKIPDFVNKEKYLNVFLDTLRHFSNMISYDGKTNNDKINIDFSVVRGLDYYEGTVFEMEYDGLGSEKQICGGGVYNLGSVTGGDFTAAGFGIGFDRLCIAAKKSGVKFNDKKAIFIVSMGEDNIEYAEKVSAELRDNGIRAVMEVSERRIQKALKYANNICAEYAVIIGDDERKNKRIVLKNMTTGEQTSESVKQAIKILNPLF